MFTRYPLLPALLWAALILVLCLMPGSSLPAWEWADLFSVDKLVHVAMFFVLAWLCAWGLSSQYRWPAVRSSPVITALFIAIAYGALTELLQQIPALGRRGDLNDLLANSLGAVLGAVYFWRRSERMIDVRTTTDA